MTTSNDYKPAPLFVSIGEDNHDSAAFRTFVQNAILDGFLHKYDILVMDNAAIHVHGENRDLEDFLWDFPSSDGTPMHIYIKLLPTQSPEWNPIELVWAVLVKKLKSRYYATPFVRDMVPILAMEVLNEMDFHLMQKCMIHQGYYHKY